MMISQRIIDRFPDFYINFLPLFLEKESPKETAKSCPNCSMIVFNSSSSIQGIVSFSPVTKCCTHYPNLPNYMVGALLADKNPSLNEGRTRIRDLIRKAVAVKPHGIMRPAKFQHLLKSSPDSFGRASSLLCPCFDSEKGICTLWPFHSAVCNTWFCKYSAGEDGRLFWLSLKDYMLHVEKVLELYALKKLGFKASEIILQEKKVLTLSAAEIDEKPLDEKAHKNLWGKWAGREEEFYKETYLTVKGLNRRSFQNLQGITGDILFKDLMIKRQKVVNPKLPAFLKRNPRLVIEKTGDDEYTLISYSGFDPMSISKRIHSIIDFFDGKTPTKEVCREILEKTKTAPSHDLLLSLYQLRVLIEK